MARCLILFVFSLYLLIVCRRGDGSAEKQRTGHSDPGLVVEPQSHGDRVGLSNDESNADIHVVYGNAVNAQKKWFMEGGRAGRFPGRT